MSPKTLTTTQKESQRQHIFERSKVPIVRYGFKKVSVDDIVKAAGIAKGTFYLYFDSKEDFITHFIINLSEKYFLLAENLLLKENSDLKSNLRQFFNMIVELPEFIFFFREHNEIREIAEKLVEHGLEETEHKKFEKLLQLGNIDTDKVKPAIVHNCIHTICVAQSTNLLIEEYKKETIELLIENLIEYIFNGRR